MDPEKPHTLFIRINSDNPMFYTENDDPDFGKIIKSICTATKYAIFFNIIILGITAAKQLLARQSLVAGQRYAVVLIRASVNSLGIYIDFLRNVREEAPREIIIQPEIGFIEPYPEGRVYYLASNG